MASVIEQRIETRKCDVCGEQHTSTMHFTAGSNPIYAEFRWKRITVQNPQGPPYMGTIECCSTACMRSFLTEKVDFDKLRDVSIVYEERPCNS